MNAPAEVISARVRVTLECPECASPIPVNGFAPTILCPSCQEVHDLGNGALAWNRIMTYEDGEACREHGVLASGAPKRALAYFLAIQDRPMLLHRRFRNVLLELDVQPPKCTECRHVLDAATLLGEIEKEQSPDAFCPNCGTSVPIRKPTQLDWSFHETIAGVACETALRGDLNEKPSTQTVLFSCMGCGAALKIGGESPRMSTCEYCDATNYIPDALWLRLHPAQRKRPFYLLMRVGPNERWQALREVNN